MPVAAKEIWLGCCLARAIRSGSVLIPDAALAQMNIGCPISEPTGRKTRGSISGRFSALPGKAMKSEIAGANSV
jgi:hypothetical protein